VECVHFVEFHLRYGWHIISPVKSFTVFASTELEKEQWMSHMQNCVDKIRQDCKLTQCFTSISQKIKILITIICGKDASWL